MEIRWKSDRQKYIEYIKRRKEIVAKLKKRAKPERLTFDEIDKMMRNNQTYRGADMKDKLDIIISALNGLRLETINTKSAKDGSYWVDHYIENAIMELRKAEKKLGGNK